MHNGEGLMGTTCPQEIATSNRRKNLNKVYASKEWEAACDKVLHRGHIQIKGIIRGEGLQVGEAGALWQESIELLQAKMPCEWHLRKTGQEVRVGTLVHHAYIESYKDGTYLNLDLIDKDILCGSCHYAIHHDLDLCKCGKYMRRGAKQCKACFNLLHPEIQADKDRKKAESKALQKKLREDEKARVKAIKKNLKLSTW
jgi:hypothetical protein